MLLRTSKLLYVYIHIITSLVDIQLLCEELLHPIGCCHCSTLMLFPHLLGYHGHNLTRTSQQASGSIRSLKLLHEDSKTTGKTEYFFRMILLITDSEHYVRVTSTERMYLRPVIGITTCLPCLFPDFF